MHIRNYEKGDIRSLDVSEQCSKGFKESLEHYNNIENYEKVIAGKNTYTLELNDETLGSLGCLTTSPKIGLIWGVFDKSLDSLSMKEIYNLKNILVGLIDQQFKNYDTLLCLTRCDEKINKKFCKHFGFEKISNIGEFELHALYKNNFYNSWGCTIPDSSSS